MSRESFTPLLPSDGSSDVEPGTEPVPWLKLAVWFAVAVAVLAALVFVVVPGYSAGEDDAVRERLAACAAVPEAVRADIASQLDAGRRLGGWAQHPSPRPPGAGLRVGRGP